MQKPSLKKDESTLQIYCSRRELNVPGAPRRAQKSTRRSCTGTGCTSRKRKPLNRGGYAWPSSSELLRACAEACASCGALQVHSMATQSPNASGVHCPTPRPSATSPAATASISSLQSAPMHWSRQSSSPRRWWGWSSANRTSGPR
jgi:hypothetical protein